VKARSLQARLLLLTLSSVLAVAMATAWMAYREAEHEVDELIDAQLVQYARIMLALAHAGDDEEAESPHIDGHRYASQVIFQIWQRDDEGDTLLLRSPEAPSQWPANVSREGYSDIQLNGSAWRCFAASDHENGRYALAAIDLHIRDELVGDIAMGNVRPYLYGLPVLTLLLIWAIRGGLAPLRRMEAELAGRSPERLDPIPEAQASRELKPLIRTMNRLFDKVTRTLDNERRFTSDAAHELRTPIAAIKAQLQVAERAQDAEEGQGAIRKALRGTDRMTHLVAQLLSLARLDSHRQTPSLTPVPLSGLAGEVIDEFAAQAAERGQRLEAQIEAGLNVPGNADLLRVLMRNLLDNAIRYTPVGGHVRLTLERRGEGVCLHIEDDGPGVSAADLEHLGERFQRFGRQSVEGVGLGLSIVRRIVDLHHAELHFSVVMQGSGLAVTVSLPASA
jgi:two-component system sensor histidine kinase QseC